MERTRNFKTVIAKLLNSSTDEWKVQIKYENYLRLGSGNLNEIEIEYRVENQAKFLLKTQQAPTLHWFSSQDGLEKLLEKSQISSKTDKVQDLGNLTLEQGTDYGEHSGFVDSAVISCPSVTEVASVPEFNTLDVYKRTRASLQFSSGTDSPVPSEVSESQEASSTGYDTSNVPSTREVSSSALTRNLLTNIVDKNNSIVCDSDTKFSEDSNHTENHVLDTQNHKDANTVDHAHDSVRPDETVSEAELIHCSKTNPSNTDKEDTEEHETCAIHSAPILPSQKTLFRTDDNIVLVVEGKKIFVSKILLSLHSEFFKAMFATDMKESQQSEIELPSIKHQILEQILQFCQKGELCVNSENVHHLLHTSHQFQIAPIIEMCEHFLTHILRQDILLELLDIADHYLLVRLLKACFKLIGHKFQQLHIQGILKQLKYEHLLALLESDIHLPDASEFQIFKVVAEWVGKDIENNKQHLDTLLDWIKFPLMQTTELSQINKLQEPWLKDSEMFQQQMKLAFKYKNCIHEQPLITGFHTMPRAAIKTVALIVEDDSILSEFNSLDCHLVPVGTSCQIPTEMFITHKMKLEWSRDGYSVAALNNFMYIGGGYNPSEDRNLSSVHRYNPVTSKWVTVQPMRHRRAAFVLCSLGTHLYAIGGRQFDSHLHAAFGLRAKTLNSVECYDTSDSWTKVANLPVGLFAHAGISCNGNLYVSGGRTDEPMGMEDTNALVCYHADTDAWIQCAPMRHNRYYHGMAAVDQKIYVAGGVNYNPSDAYGVWNFVTEPESYNTVTGQWTALAHMPHRRSQVAVTAVAQKVYVIGGLPHPGVDGKREVLEYNIEKDEWQASKLKYPAFWPTQCCILYFSPAVIEHASKLSDFERDRRHSAVREVLYSFSRIPHA